MGLQTTDIIQILKLYNGNNEKNMCMMGKQFINIEWKKFMDMVDQFGFDYKEDIYEEIKDVYPVDAYVFFKMFGFVEVHAVDVMPYEGADIIFDLNRDDALPDDLYEKFDLVIDGGTLEHVFNVNNAIRNMSYMVKENGYIFHLVPAAGLVNHGFYSISPTFFLDYYGKQFNIVELKMKFLLEEWEFNQCYNNEVFSQDCRLWSYNEVHKINKYISKINSITDCEAVLLLCLAQKKSNVKNACPVQQACRKLYEPKETKERVIRRSVINYVDIFELFRQKNKKIALYGGGYECNLLLNELFKNNMEDIVQLIFDTDSNRAGTKYRGYDIYYPTKQKLRNVDIIFIASTKYAEMIYSFLLEQDVEEIEIYKITDFVSIEIVEEAKEE